MLLAAAVPEVEADFDATGGVRRLSWSAAPTFASHEMIDRVGAATGEAVTVFALRPDGEFERRTTTILTDSGTRAVGTVLGRNGAAHRAVASVAVFRGEAQILGRPYLTVYEPIHAADGSVDGVLFAGTPLANLWAIWLRVVGWVLGLAAVAIAVAAPVVEETGTALRSILDAIRKVSDTICEISEASREQASGVDEITSAIAAMDEITQQNSALAEESASAAKGVTAEAEGLETLMGFFSIAGAKRRSAAVEAWDADGAADATAARLVAKVVA